MCKKPNNCLALIFFVVLFYNNSFTQLRWLISPETGYFNSIETTFINQNDLFARINAELNYKSEIDNKKFLLSIRARPELYGIEEQFRALRLGFNAGYTQESETYNWAINSTFKKQFFDSRGFRYSSDVLVLGFGLGTTFYDLLPVDFSAGYATQNISIGNLYEVDMLFGEINSYTNIFSNLNMVYGIYLESFFINNKQNTNYSYSPNRNKGWRYGVKTSFKYVKSLIAAIDYRFVNHQSELTRSFSYEHWMRIILGKLVDENISVFILGDLFIRKLLPSGNFENTDLIMLYLPLELENRLHLKISYSIKAGINLFTKGGYFREDFSTADYSLSTWFLSLGIEISNDDF